MQTETLKEILIIGGTILSLIGIVQLTNYIIRRTALPPISWWRVGGKETPTTYEAICRNYSILYLQEVVNHRKVALHRLLESGFITWAEYHKLYDKLISWKEEILKDIDDRHFTFLYI